MSRTAIIIGAGIAGLAAAIRLRSAGLQVQVIEANDYVGGKLTEVGNDQYRFDAGPSLFTMPQYVDELFEIAGRNPRQYYSYQRLDTICRYYWDDGTELTTYQDVPRTAEAIATELGESTDSVVNHLADSKLKYELTGKTFLEHSLHKLKGWLQGSTLRAITQLHKLDLLRSMHSVNASRFQNEKTVQLFDRYATYNGSDPYKTPGLLNIIPHYEYSFGAYYPDGGMHSITKAVYELAQDIGVQFTLGERVTAIDHSRAEVKGVSTEKGYYTADIIVSNMDIYYTYGQLLADSKRAKKVRKQERSSSALIFYWGVKGRWPHMDLHNIFFSSNYQAEFDAISKGEVCDDPTVYVNISSKMTASDAPRDCENWFTMINVPHDSGQDWSDIAATARANIIAKLSKRLGVPFADLVEYEDVLDPIKIDQRTMSHTGSLYGTSSNSKWAAFLRHPNFTSQISGLYFCGGSVHPGGGIPLCLLSAKIVHDLVIAKYGISKS